MSKQQIIKGTFILSLSGIACRFLGFFYKIYLSRVLSGEMLGRYQLIFPVYGICLTIFSGPIVTGISNLSAGIDKTPHPFAALKTGMYFSVSMSFINSIFLSLFAEPIAAYLLQEPTCAPALRILSISFPFCAIHNCINGYYYGLRKTCIPALSQLLEQCVRIVFIIIAPYYLASSAGFDLELAVTALVIAEAIECVFCVVSFAFYTFKNPLKGITKERITYSSALHKSFGLPMLKYCYPLLFSRLIISFLCAFEAVLIPSMLRKYGMDYSSSLSVYGILTGMALPFILFPNAFSSSYSTLMLSEIAKAKADNNTSKLSSATSISFSFASGLGVISSTTFLVFGKELGLVVFNNPIAGMMISTLSVICIFMYLSSIMSSILNGLGMTKTTFINSISAMLLRLALLALLIPYWGFGGYVLGLLVSDSFLCFLNIYAIKKHIAFNLNLGDNAIKPIILSLSFAICFYYIYKLITASYTSYSSLLNIIILMVCCGMNIILTLITTRGKNIINK